MPGASWLQQVLNIVCNVFDAHSALLFLTNGQGAFPLAASFSLSDRLQKDVVMEPGKGLVGWILRDRQPLLINNFDEKRGILGYYEPAEEARVRAFMGCPLDDGSGVLCLDSRRTYSFSTKDQKILHQFTQLIVSLRAAEERILADDQQCRYHHSLRLMYGLRAKFPRWSSYLHNLLSLLSETTGFSHCLFAARDETGKAYFIDGENQPAFKGARKDQSFPIGSGTVGWVFRNGQPLVADEKDVKAAQTALFGKELKTPAFRSMICMPLFIHKKTRGVLVLASETPVAVGEELKMFLTMVSENLALFLENLYLKNRLTMAKMK